MGLNSNGLSEDGYAKCISCRKKTFISNLELCVEMMPVFWTIDTLDWKVKNTEKILSTVETQIEDGAIILMHDEYETSVEAALQVADLLKEQGYELVTVDQLIMP